MITREINEWLRKIECSNYSKEDILEEFVHFMRYLTKEEVLMIKKRIEELL